jgi:transketolase
MPDSSHPSLTLAEKALRTRISILSAIHKAGTGHAGSSLSIVDVLTYLYDSVLRYDVHRPDGPDRDWLIFSKGHGAPALYACLAHAGFFDPGELVTLRGLGSRLQGHPKAGLLPGVDVSTGSLGQGLSIACGLALSFLLRRRANRAFCILGDGEMQEGQNWEAMMAAAALNLDNLIVIVDRNGLQNDGPTEDIVALGDLTAKAIAFGWYAEAFDGHDFCAIEAAIRRALAADRPAMLVANTVKGKGVSYMEGVVHWHHHPISDADYAQAMRELEANVD